MAKTYVLIGEEQLGPYSEDELKGLFATGKITAETPCWREGISEWQVLGSMEAFASKLPAPATVAPPRRTQPAENNHTYVAVDYREKPPKGKTLSARVKPVTLFNALGLLILFFLILTVVIYLFGRTVPDMGKQFEEIVRGASGR